MLIDKLNKKILELEKEIEYEINHAEDLARNLIQSEGGYWEEKALKEAEDKQVTLVLKMDNKIQVLKEFRDELK